MKYGYKRCLGRVPVGYTSSLQSTVMVKNGHNFSENYVQCGHRSAVLHDERLVNSFTRPSAAAALSIHSCLTY